MHLDRPWALHGNPTINSDARPAFDGEVYLLRRREVDVLGGGDKFDVFLGEELHLVALRLQVDVVLGGNELDAGVALACLDGAGQEADGLAGVDSGFAGDGEVGVFAAFEDEGFAVGEVQVLPGDGGDAGFAGLEDGGVGELRTFVGGLGVLVVGVCLGCVLLLGINHAAGDGVERFEGSCLVVGPGLVLALAA